MLTEAISFILTARQIAEAKRESAVYQISTKEQL